MSVCVCENPQAGAGVGAVASTGKMPVCVKAALDISAVSVVIVIIAICDIPRQ